MKGMKCSKNMGNRIIKEFQNILILNILKKVETFPKLKNLVPPFSKLIMFFIPISERIPF